MESKCEHGSVIKLLRTELKKLRDQIRGLRAQHVKDMSKLNALLKSPQQISRAETSDFPISPIGFVSTWHQNKNGIPRQGCLAKSTCGIIDLAQAPKFHPGFENPQFSLENLDEFSYVWIIFYFHENSNDKRNFVKTKVAPPRLGGDRVGLFSTRSPHRPNPIGLTLSKLVKVEGTKVHLQGLDLLDGTPILDIKPYIPSYDAPQADHKPIIDTSAQDQYVQDSISNDKYLSVQENTEIKSANDQEPMEIKVPDWISNDKYLTVQFTDRALKQLNNLPLENEFKDHQDIIKAITEVLQEDPRSNYRKDKCSDKLYYFSVDYIKVTCWFDDNIVEVLKVCKKSLK